MGQHYRLSPRRASLSAHGNTHHGRRSGNASYRNAKRVVTVGGVPRTPAGLFSEVLCFAVVNAHDAAEEVVDADVVPAGLLHPKFDAALRGVAHQRGVDVSVRVGVATQQ